MKFDFSSRSENGVGEKWGRGGFLKIKNFQILTVFLTKIFSPPSAAKVVKIPYKNSIKIFRLKGKSYSLNNFHSHYETIMSSLVSWVWASASFVSSLARLACLQKHFACDLASF